MMRYEKLLDEIEQGNTFLVQTKSDRQPAKSMRMGRDCAIFFDESAFETNAERFVALAHEKGHCDSGIFYNIHTPLQTRGRCEYLAWKWAVIEYLPFDKLIEAVHACKTAEGVSAHELAEYLEITADFLALAIDTYICLGKQIA